MRLGSLFTGLGLLDQGVLDVLGGDLAWFAEHDPADERRSAYCRAVVQARHPAAVSLGNVTTIDGAQLAAVDVLALGFPCQDISPAGSGGGLQGARSGLWAHVPRILREMRAAGTALPTTLIIENSSYLPARGLGVVLRDLAALGYTAGWQVIGANGVGAPHRRERTAVVARLDGRVPTWPDLRALQRANVADWFNPEQEPAPRTVAPYPRGDARVRWRTDAVAALGNGVCLPWARMVATAARDAAPPALGLLGEPLGARLSWDADALPPAGVMVGGELYTEGRVYSRGDAERAMLETAICRLYGRLLPTPTKGTYGSNQGGAAGRQGPVRPALQTLARELPSTLGRLAARGDLAAMLATPTRKGNDNRAGLTERSGDGLATQARAMRADQRATLLHPAWVAWLMGAPASMVPLLGAVDSEAA